MTTMQFGLINLLAVIVPSVFATVTVNDESGGKTTSALQGSWTVQVAEKAGRKETDAELKEFSLEFSETRCVWKAGGKSTELAFTIDPSKNPKQIDLMSDGKKLAGIYELAGDRLKMCLSASGARPSQFVSTQAEKTVILELERVKR